MKNLKITAKLLTGFGIVLVMVIVLGMASLWGLQALNQTSKGFAKVSIPAIDNTWTVRRDLVSIQRYLLQIIATTSKEDVDTATKNIAGERDKLLKALDEIVILVPDFSSRVDVIKADLDVAAKHRKQIEEKCSTLTPEDNLAAYDLFVREYVPVFDKIAKETISMYDDVTKRIDNRVEEADKTATQCFVLIFTVFTAIILLTIIVTYLITRSIMTPVKQLETAAKEMAQGNLNVNINYDSRDELGALTRSFITLRETIFLLIHKINIMSVEMENGDIDARIPETEFNGEYRNVANAINNSISGIVGDILTILSGFSKFGNGDFNAQLVKFPGKKAVINKSFDEIKSNLSSVSGDINRLIDAANVGKIDERIDTSLYNGDWKKLTDGLNVLLQNIGEPIDEANVILARLSEGDFDVKVSSNYKGSFAKMMDSFDRMVTSIGSYIVEITQILELIAQGDLRGSISREYVGQFDLIKVSINNIGQTLRNTIAEIQSSSDNVLSGARQISETAMDLANGASVQASTVEELSASIMLINEQTKKTADDSQSANQISQHSINSAKEGSYEMEQMLTSMDEIKAASNSISDIIKVIDDIAFQTNLLALNAAVEAARAGEHGKGFAVVASEVRSLAVRSAQSAKDTSVLIEDAIHKINEGTVKAKETAASLGKIVEDISAVSETIAKINHATNEQSTGISQITEGINQISKVIQSNSSTSEESAAAAEELNSMASMLDELVTNFKI